MQRSQGRPAAQGLYDPSHEHDACGVGFVAQIDGTKSHALVHQGIQVLERMEHRGACGCDPETGDGAGILIQLPDRFLRREAAAARDRAAAARRLRLGHGLLVAGRRDRARGSSRASSAWSAKWASASSAGATSR